MKTKSKRDFVVRKQALVTLVILASSSNESYVWFHRVSAFSPRPERRSGSRIPSTYTVASDMFQYRRSEDKTRKRLGRGSIWKNRCRMRILNGHSSTSLCMSSTPTPRPPVSNFSPIPVPKFLQRRDLDDQGEKPTIKNDLEIAENAKKEKRRSIEMATMSAISLTLAITVIYALASSTDVEPNEVKEFFGSEGRVERLEIATRNIVNVALPQSADDVIAVSIGEGIAGAIGAVATFLLGTILKFRVDDDVDDVVARVVKTTEGMSGNGANLLFSEVVADGDYFLTRAAALPLFEAIGIPTFLASLASVLLATLPYEAIKLSQQKKIQLQKDAVLMDMLLKEEESRIQQRGGVNIVDEISNRFLEFMQRLDVRQANVDVVDDSESVILENLPPPPSTTKQDESNAPLVDYVEIFADITKWLEYDVLISNYRGILSVGGQELSPGVESAIFGLLAALSSQLYTDVLYIYSEFGNPAKREKTLNRSIEGWTSLYATKCLSSATLFGVYEAARAPTSRFMRQLVSGGVEGCTGSDDFDLCMETYLMYNPPAASYQAEFRAFIVSAMNWVDSLTDLIPSDFIPLARATIVSIYSLVDNFFSF